MKNDTIEPTIERDGETISTWQNGNIDLPMIKTMADEERIYDTLIVGAGITGLTTALLLQQSGQKCVIAEGHTIGFGSTSGTSAHLNTFFDATYPEIEKDFSEDAAKLVAESGIEAFALIRRLIEKYNIECELEYKDAYVYSENDKESEELLKIMEASRRAGIMAAQATENGLNIPFSVSVLFKDQGQFHPVKYILALASAFIAAGGIILENTFIRDTVFEDDLHLAKTSDSSIRAKNIVYATHIPPGINVLHFRCAPYRSYVLGIRLKDNVYPENLVYDMQEPYHYIRTHVIDGQSYLILGGEDHKTGHEDPEKAFKNLETYARNYFDVESVEFRWSSQYYVPADGLPYIGLLPGGDDRSYTATGFNGNGMMFGTLSAKIISDMILGEQNKYADLYSPSRMKPVAGFMDFLKENTDVAYHFIADRFSAESISSLKELEADSGTVIDYEGQRLAVYKNTDEKVQVLSSVCTHAGCIVNFNPAEKSWDCPCHGGRFDLNGKVISGPPRQDLQQIDLDK
jgi:glycine/D-amino acid oxidase-like deaminating enzyme/nitrite reductase/ring-hydroxylating ferredoxin subunit